MHIPKTLLPWSLALLALVPAQERVAKSQRPTFDQALQQLGQAWKEQRFGAVGKSLGHLQRGYYLGRIEALHRALPKAPEGWTLEPQEAKAMLDQMTDAQAAPLLMGLGASAASQHRYTGPSRSGLQIQVMADSPLVAVLAQAFAAPERLRPDQELVRYGQHKALLSSQPGGRGAELQILLEGKHLVQAKLHGESAEFLLGLMDQAAVDRLAKLLSN